MEVYKRGGESRPLPVSEGERMRESEYRRLRDSLVHLWEWTESQAGAAAKYSPRNAERLTNEANGIYQSICALDAHQKKKTPKSY